MVEFCTICGTSLPKGDLTVKGGSIFTSHDYNCPSCGKTANPAKDGEAAEPEISVDSDLIFKKGSVKSD
ncbi:MAG TPA: hypothetical protein VKU80_14250 [Planctomycetota bacterium]|nr:hypothetical protein [Planctomycetota bacterium]